MKFDGGPMMQTPSQTVGPYFVQGLLREGDNLITNVLTTESTQGERIRIEGQVTDGERRAVDDALIEIWQANRHGRYHYPLGEPLDSSFRGYGRAATDSDGRYWFETIKPGPVPGPGNSIQAPHINTIVFARGMPAHAFTRIYFEDDARNAEDPVLKSVEDETRRQSLLAKRLGSSKGKIVYRFDIHLQGENETAFFDA